MSEPFDPLLAIKSAIARVVDLIGTGRKASTFTRVNATRLSVYANPAERDVIPLDVALALDMAAGKPVIGAVYADLLGYDLAPRNTVAAPIDLPQQAGLLAKLTGALVADVIAASADETISVNEARRIEAAAAKIDDQLAALRAATRKTTKKR